MTAALWTASEVAAAVGGRKLADFAATGVSIDSRKVAPGDLFIALHGPNFDGHDFIAGALRAGAAGIIADHLPAGIGASAPLILVEDTLAALGALGIAARNRSTAKIIAVTGSVGKTSTKEMLRAVLGAQAPAFASEGNLNNHWGAPLSLARMPRDVAYGIFELGMNHAGEIRPLARMVRPHAAIITAVEAVHIEFFSSVAAIADAKAEILEGLEPGGTAILPRDNVHFQRMVVRARELGTTRIIGFGADVASEVRLVSCITGSDGNLVEAEAFGQKLKFTTGLAGRHQAINALAVLAGVHALGGNVARAARDLGAITALKGRGRRELVQTGAGSFTLIDESYNASPAAMRAALAVLAGLSPEAGGRRLVVLGDMRELGSEGPALHRGLAPDIVTAGIGAAFLVGPLMAELYGLLPEDKRACHAMDSHAMAAPVVACVRPGDIVLVKGSLGTRMAPIVEAIRAMDISAAIQPKAANGH